MPGSTCRGPGAGRQEARQTAHRASAQGCSRCEVIGPWAARWWGRRRSLWEPTPVVQAGQQSGTAWAGEAGTWADRCWHVGLGRERKRDEGLAGSCPKQRAGWTILAEGLFLFPLMRTAPSSPSLGSETSPGGRKGYHLPSPSRPGGPARSPLPWWQRPLSDGAQAALSPETAPRGRGCGGPPLEGPQRWGSLRAEHLQVGIKRTKSQSALCRHCGNRKPWG